MIRILPMNQILDLSQLGVSPSQLKIFETLINKPHGIIFMTGPTGSGKSTTLYTCLNKINTDKRKIITIEDPVEYEMEGVTQIQVSPAIGLDFARGLRSMLRHDPDVMMVGEVRDLETAEIAIRVALTGHLVFSTLHTNDAASGITRLIDIGVEPYLVASSVEAFIAQRLVRIVCPACKQEDKSFSADMKREIVKELGLVNANFKIYHGKACKHCDFTGFYGRLAIYEILLMTDNIKRMIMKRATAGDIKHEAISQGMCTLWQDGWQKVIAGLTTPGEIFDATRADEQYGPRGEAVEIPFENKKTAGVSDFSLAVKDQGVSRGERNGSRLEDHRIFVRLETNVNIFYRVLKIPQNPDESITKNVPEERALTKNISAGGLLFFTDKSIPVSAILELKIKIPDEQESLECLGRVIRQEEIKTPKIYETAVCFLDLSSHDRKLLEKFVKKEKK